MKLLKISFIVIAFFGAIGVYNFIFQPKDIGLQLEYIGKRDYGCWFLCGSLPTSTYYFSTDMTPSQLDDYFKRGDCETGGRIFSASYEGVFLNCTTSEGRVSIVYYDTNPQNVVSTFDLKQSDRSFVVGINKSIYRTMKSML